MSRQHKSDDYKTTAVEYYLTEDTTQDEVCRIFKCSARSLMRWELIIRTYGVWQSVLINWLRFQSYQKRK
jgi:hypothetical protein